SPARPIHLSRALLVSNIFVSKLFDRAAFDPIPALHCGPPDKRVIATTMCSSRDIYDYERTISVQSDSGVEGVYAGRGSDRHRYGLSGDGGLDLRRACFWPAGFDAGPPGRSGDRPRRCRWVRITSGLSSR